MGFNSGDSSDGMMSFGGHLEVLRRMLFRVLGISLAIGIVVFFFKETTFRLLLAPSHPDFVTYRTIEHILGFFGSDFHFEPFQVNLISTELSSQFMAHITTSFMLGVLFSSPYILFELFRFVAPALYSNERRHAVKISITVYVLFILGVLMTYYVLFPISFRFLGTYNVSEQVVSNITIDSYISTFTSLTLVMGLVFQLPIIAFLLGRMGLISSSTLSKYRKHSFIIIMLVAAIITPPDIMTLILVTIPLYLLFEISIRVVKFTEK